MTTHTCFFSEISFSGANPSARTAVDLPLQPWAAAVKQCAGKMIPKIIFSAVQVHTPDCDDLRCVPTLSLVLPCDDFQHEGPSV